MTREEAERRTMNAMDLTHRVLNVLNGEEYGPSVTALGFALITMVIANPKCETALDAIDRIRTFPEGAEAIVYDMFSAVKESFAVRPRGEVPALNN